MKTSLPWLAALCALTILTVPASADRQPDDYYDDEEYYEDDGYYEEDDYRGPEGDVDFGLHIGPDSFGLYFDEGDYREYGGGSRFGLRFDGFGGSIFFEGDRGRRYQRGHWYCPRSHCRGRGRRWGRGFGRGRARGYGRFDCHPVYKRGFRRRHEVLIRATMCYDRDGNAYIVPGSRRVVRRFR